MRRHTTNSIEALMLHAFRTEPFHNLRLIYDEDLGATIPGGTCSDKTMSFVNTARHSGATVKLHSAFIGGKEIHRLARVHLGNRVYFADVGNGWPSIRLYPADRPTVVRCFGMAFRTEVTSEVVNVYHLNKGRESLQMEIPVHGRPESEILEAIKMRFRSGVSYPFAKELRFSAIVGERFLFLRGQRLEIYTETGHFECRLISPAEASAALHNYFGYDLGHITLT